MGQWAQIGAAALQVGGGLYSDKQAKGASEADRKAQERLVRLSLQNERDMDRERWERERQLWRDAATSMSNFSNASHLAQYTTNSPTPRVETPGTGFFDGTSDGRPRNGR